MTKSWDAPTASKRLSDVAGVALGTVRVEVVRGVDMGQTQTSPEDALTVGTAPGNTLQLTDPTVSRFHLELRREGDRIRVTDLGSTNGTLFAGAYVQSASLAPGAVLELGDTHLAVHDGKKTFAELNEDGFLFGLVGNSASMRRLMAAVGRAAQSAVPALIVGESGTGKELVARALHESGPRSSLPFVIVDCGAMSETLISSELFGHERGSFTGATHRHSGAFERADNGVVFLDEIGELPPASQAMLLGVLERGTYRRVGGRDELPLRARVVAATNRDLRADVNKGSFRLDLYYRLAIITLRTPALRDHLDDLPFLVQHLLKRSGFEGALDDVVPAALMERLQTHAWPGNVRELRNLIDARVAMGGLEPDADESDLPLTESVTVSSGGQLAPYSEARAEVTRAFEERYLRELYAQCRGNVAKGARMAGMDRSHLIDLLRRHKIRD